MRIKTAIIGGLIALASVLTFSQTTQATPNDKVTICHATNSHSNPYTVNTVDESSVDEQNNKYLNGHGDHTGPVWYPGIADHSWGDIIPPFRTYPGHNWTAEGQAIWNNGCDVPTPTKDDEVTYGDWLGEPECDETSYTESRTVTTVSFTWKRGQFVAGDPVVTVEYRTVQVEEVEPCPTTPTTTEPPVTTVPPTTEPPVTTQPPTTEPPATTQPPVVTTTEPPTVSIGTAPVPPTQPPFTPTATPSDELPATGISNGLLLLIGAGMLGAGALLIAAARRRNTTI